MKRRTLLKGMAATAASGLLVRSDRPRTASLKIGISMPMTGAGFNAVGRQLQAALKLYMAAARRYGRRPQDRAHHS